MSCGSHIRQHRTFLSLHKILLDSAAPETSHVTERKNLQGQRNVEWSEKSILMRNHLNKELSEHFKQREQHTKEGSAWPVHKIVRGQYGCNGVSHGEGRYCHLAFVSSLTCFSYYSPLVLFVPVTVASCWSSSLHDMLALFGMLSYKKPMWLALPLCSSFNSSVHSQKSLL